MEGGKRETTVRRSASINSESKQSRTALVGEGSHVPPLSPLRKARVFRISQKEGGKGGGREGGVIVHLGPEERKGNLQFAQKNGD